MLNGYTAKLLGVFLNMQIVPFTIKCYMVLANEWLPVIAKASSPALS